MRRISFDDEASRLEAINDTIYTDGENFRQLFLNARELATRWLSAHHSKEDWERMLYTALAGSTKDTGAHKRRTIIVR